VSASTADVVADHLPDRAALVRLGSYRLRGIELPEPVHQLNHPDLEREFPPLRGGAAGNLPEPLTSFVGRAREIEELSAMLESRRLLTLTGAAGVGKTRLAIEVAGATGPRFPDGIWFCELAPVRDPAAVPRALIGTFGLTEEQGRSPEQILNDYVRAKRLLVVLDNCEHLVAACADLCASLLKDSPGSSVVATSREPLGAEGEATWRVPSLALPEAGPVPLADLGSTESVALFCERARASKPAFGLDEHTASAVAQICRRLDGIPLAIELAAGKVDVMDAEEIALGVEDRFQLLTGGPRTALERQQTMRAAVDWSYSLVSEDERSVLRRLGVFVGGFTLEAARQVWGTEEGDVDELIRSLARKSLVARDPDWAGRFVLLETIRAYAAEKLADAGEAPVARAAHMRFFCALAAEAAAPLEGGAAQQEWLEILSSDHENLQAAVSFATTKDPDAGLRLCADIADYWSIRGHWRLGREALEPLLAATANRRTMDRARALRAAGEFAIKDGDHEVARIWLDESLSVAREHGDRTQIAWGIGSLAAIAEAQGDYESAQASFERSLAIAREDGNRSQIAGLVAQLGNVAQVRRDYTTAGARFEESLAIARELGDRTQIASALRGRGMIALLQGDSEIARTHTSESLAIARELGNRRQIAWAVRNLGFVADSQGHGESARAHLEEALAIAREIGDRRLLGWTLCGLGVIATEAGDYESARVHLEEAVPIARETAYKQLIAVVMASLGEIAREQGDYERARTDLEESLAIAREMADRLLTARTVSRLGSIALWQGDVDGARSHYVESLTLGRELGFPEFSSWILSGCAAFVAATGAHETACTVAGAVDAAREHLGIHLGVFDRAQVDESLAHLREVLDPLAFDASWARGRAMSLEEAFDLALTI
jgi:predicted ATPase